MFSYISNKQKVCFVVGYVYLILINLSKAWILGSISKKDFYDRATLHRKGDVDRDNGYTFKADCYNLRIDRLDPIHEIQQ